MQLIGTNARSYYKQFYHNVKDITMVTRDTALLTKYQYRVPLTAIKFHLVAMKYHCQEGGLTLMLDKGCWMGSTL